MISIFRPWIIGLRILKSSDLFTSFYTQKCVLFALGLSAIIFNIDTQKGHVSQTPFSSCMGNGMDEMGFNWECLPNPKLA